MGPARAPQKAADVKAERSRSAAPLPGPASPGRVFASVTLCARGGPEPPAPAPAGAAVWASAAGRLSAVPVVEARRPEAGRVLASRARPQRAVKEPRPLWLARAPERGGWGQSPWRSMEGWETRPGGGCAPRCPRGGARSRGCLLGARQRAALLSGTGHVCRAGSWGVRAGHQGAHRVLRGPVLRWTPLSPRPV